MEEEILIGEQPQSVVQTTSAAASDDLGGINEESGSLKKFKSTESLLRAYEDLEKEFTRKSQKLSELEKTIEADNVEKSTPEYSKENWREKTKEFLEKNSEAKKFAGEISQMLHEDKDLACLPNSLELAYAKILASKYKSNEELVEDNNFLTNHIYNNEKIVETIIKKYISEVNNKNIPPIILNPKASSVGFVAPAQPNNLGEAKALVEKLFTLK